MNITSITACEQRIHWKAVKNDSVLLQTKAAACLLLVRTLCWIDGQREALEIIRYKQEAVIGIADKPVVSQLSGSGGCQQNCELPCETAGCLTALDSEQHTRSVTL